MAKTKEISYHHGMTVKTGKFTTSRVDAGLVRILEEGDDPEQAYQELRRDVLKKLFHDVGIIKAGIKEETPAVT